MLIPNLVDDKIFRFEEKDPDLRKKVFLTRKFDNVSTVCIGCGGERYRGVEPPTVFL